MVSNSRPGYTSRMRRLIWVYTGRNSVSGIITLYLYPPEMEFVGPDQSVRTALAYLGRYITLNVVAADTFNWNTRKPAFKTA